MSSSKPATANDDSQTLVRSILSLMICIHLVCVAVVLASNFRRSPLQQRLVGIFAAYTKLLDFDPEFTPYYYTLGRNIDDDTWFEIDLYPSGDLPVTQQEIAKYMRLPEEGSNWLGNRRRAFQLAKLLALYADPENEQEDITSEIARAVGGWAMRQTNNNRAVVRCVRRMSQPYNLATLNAGFPQDKPTDRAYDSTVYEADVWTDEDKQVQSQKRASRAEVAPRQRNPQTAPATNDATPSTPQP